MHYSYSLKHCSSSHDEQAVRCLSGASFGQWKLPWGPLEREDSLAVLDWMTAQPWCNGKVGPFAADPSPSL